MKRITQWTDFRIIYYSQGLQHTLTHVYSHYSVHVDSNKKYMAGWHREHLYRLHVVNGSLVAI